MNEDTRTLEIRSARAWKRDATLRVADASKSLADATLELARAAKTLERLELWTRADELRAELADVEKRAADVRL